MTEPIDTEATNNPVCPHCGREELDAWELDFQGDDMIEHECGRCGELYMIRRSVSVCYFTTKKKEASHD